MKKLSYHFKCGYVKPVFNILPVLHVEFAGSFRFLECNLALVIGWGFWLIGVRVFTLDRPF